MYGETDEVMEWVAKGELSLDGQPSDGFFIPRDFCNDCGICQVTAKGIIAEGPNGVSAFQRHPQGKAELWSVYRAARECHVECIYYGGSDPEIRANMEQARKATKDFNGDPE